MPFSRPKIAGPACSSKDFIARADGAREAGRYQEAAFLYGEAVRLQPHRADLEVQRGHMHKEAGDLDAAGLAYQRAASAMPGDADLALQIGHLFKLQGRPTDALGSYQRALALKPGWHLAKREVEAMEHLISGEPSGLLAAAASSPGNTDSREQETLQFSRALQLSAALAPGAPLHALHAHGEEIATRRLGKRERTPWGLMNVLRGVQAFRGFVISRHPAVRIDISINGQLVHRGGLRGGFVLPHERDDPSIRKYVFNAWIDLSDFVEGRYRVALRVFDSESRVFEHHDEVVISPPLTPNVLPDSDAHVPPPDAADPRSLDTQINARPSMVRPGRRSLLAVPPRTILVQRPDALGDLVVAVPALRRLRELFPDATIVGMLSPANVDLARTLKLFDDIIVTELVFDPWERRRVVSVELQRRLAEDLARFKFDMAIDLGTSPDSRLLLPLAGAPVLVGFRADDLPRLTVEVTGGTNDPWDGLENVPHTNMAIGLIEWLNAMMRSEQNLLRREDLGPQALAAFGLLPDTKFVVLHAGGRWRFSRWPYYAQLAELLLSEARLHVLFMTNDPGDVAALPTSLTQNRRFQVMERRLKFDELDALLSYCSLFIGDDSGVKHLAAMRGAQVIGIQSARNNWSEWGQENGGYVITRKVPCAGCLIQNYPESDECGRDFVCITAITAEEVFTAARSLLAEDS